MSCSVAVTKSPVFSPPPSLFCNVKASSVITPPSSPSSPFRLRLQKAPTGSPLYSNSVASLSSPEMTTILKRKRPARLDIPIAVTAMAFGAPATPCVSTRETENEEEGYFVYCKKGRREAMEDRFSAVSNLQGDPKQVLLYQVKDSNWQAFFGVYDGHGGAKAAEFAAERLDKNILDEVVRRSDEGGDISMKEAVKDGYLRTDEEFLKEDIPGGACCVTALIRKGKLAVSNAGDCRAVMSRGGAAEALTSDHRASRPDEKDRIEGMGGYVDLSRGGVWRVQGSLAVSRGIGDGHLKHWVIAEPETREVELGGDCEFLILASDGLWDKVSNQEAVDMARPLCVAGGVDHKPAEPLLACKKLVDLAVARGSFDDTTVMIIQLRPYCI